MAEEQALPSKTTYSLLDLSLYSSRIDTLYLMETWLDSIVDDAVETVALVGDDIPMVYATHVIASVRSAIQNMRLEHENDLAEVLGKIGQHSVENATNSTD